MDERKRPASTRLKFGKAEGAEKVTNWNTGVGARAAASARLQRSKRR